MARERIIMHYDMDAFYASVEIRDNPKLKGKAIVVGENVVTTASYEARKYGIHSAMSVMEARKLCRHLIIVPVSKGKYGMVSEKIQNLVRKITDKIEFIALDEGYIDLTEIIEKYEGPEYFARKFKEGIERHTKLTCSVGIGYNKLTAKIASDINKPGGIYIFSNQKEFIEYVKDKNVKIIPGVGKKMRQDLKEKLNIEKVQDVYKYSLTELISKIGKSRGESVYEYSRGSDYRSVTPRRKSHSIGNENTFKYPLETREEIEKELSNLFDKTHKRLIAKQYTCKTVTIKMRDSDRKTITRSKTLRQHRNSKMYLYEATKVVLEEIEEWRKDKKVRLLGISFGNLSKNVERQLTFKEQNQKKLKKKVDIEILKEKIKILERDKI